MTASPPSLFDFVGAPPVHKNWRQAAISWIARRRRHFSFFVVLSLVAHLALFGMVIILGPQAKAPVSAAALRARDFQAFKDSLEELASDGQTPERLANALMSLSASDIEEAFRQAPVLDYRLNDREKAGLYKTMLGQAMTEF